MEHTRTAGILALLVAPSLAATPFAATPFAATPLAGAQCFDQEIPRPSSFETWGSDLAVDGALAAIGARTTPSGSITRGAVQVLDYDPSSESFTPRQMLFAGPGDNSQWFGHSLDLSGPNLVVGAPLFDFSASFTNTGRVHFYRFDDMSGVFVEEASQTPNGSFQLSRLGWCVAVDGDRAIVNEQAFGRAYVYLRNASGNWNIEQILEPPIVDSNQSDDLLALQGDTAFLGSPGESGGGALYVYRRSGGTWAQVQRLEASDQTHGYRFGTNVAVQGDVLVSTAVPTSTTGVAYVFRFDDVTGQWSEQQKLVPPGSAGINAADVGADVVTLATHIPAEVHVYRFDASTGVWDLAETLVPIPPIIQSLFRTALSEHSILARVGNTVNGQVHALGVGCGPLGASYCGPAVANSSGAAATIVARGSTTVGHGDFRLEAGSLPVGQFGYFLASQNQGLIAQPGGSQGVLCLGLPIGRLIDSLQSSGVTGTLTHRVDLSLIPTLGPVLPGETWNFQAWFRDGATSNFTDGVSVPFD